MKKTIIRNIKAQLKARRMTVRELCLMLGVNINYVSQITDATTVQKLERIADAIGCEPADLLRRT